MHTNLENNCKGNEANIRPSYCLEVKSVPESNIVVYSRSLANFRTVTTCTSCNICIIIEHLIWRRHCTAVTLTCERCCSVIRKRESNNWETLVLAINSEEVHKGKRWSNIWFSDKWLFFTGLENLACVVRFKLKVYQCIFDASISSVTSESSFKSDF